MHYTFISCSIIIITLIPVSFAKNIEREIAVTAECNHCSLALWHTFDASNHCLLVLQIMTTLISLQVLRYKLFVLLLFGTVQLYNVMMSLAMISICTLAKVIVQDKEAK